LTWEWKLLPSQPLSFLTPFLLNPLFLGSSTALSLIELSSSPHYLYPAIVQGDHVWLKLSYPNLLLLEGLDQPPAMVWPIPYLRGYGQVHGLIMN
jgi:hypothetical protein